MSAERRPLDRGAAHGESYRAGSDGAILRPSAADISDLLRSRPRDGDPDEIRAAWVARKHALLAAIEESTR